MSNFKNSLYDATLGIGNVALGLLAGKNQRINKVKNMISNCSYSKSNNNYVLKSSEDILNAYQQLEPHILTYTQNYKMKSFIQFKGHVTVDYKGTQYAVNINLMIPENFPTQAPFIRIINIDPLHYSVDPYYQKYQSKNDPSSYLLSQLSVLKNWNFYTNIINVVQQSQQLMSQRFPFKKKKNIDINKTNEAYQNNQYPGFNQPNFNQPGFNQPTYNPTGFNQPTYNQPIYNQSTYNPNGFNQPGFNQPGFNQPGYNQPGFNQPGFNQPGYNNNQATGFGFNSNSNYNGYNNNQFNNFNDPKNTNSNQTNYNQINDAIKLQVQDFGARNYLFIDETKKTIDYIQTQHQNNLSKVQTLEVIDKCLADEIKSLNEQIKNLQVFVKANENQNQNTNLNDFVKPSDQLSNQLLDFVCQLKACEQSLALLESKFSEDKINLEGFLKLARKIEQQRFMSKVMIKKCMKQIKK